MRERRMLHSFLAKPSIYAAWSSFFFAPQPYDHSTTGREASRIGRPPETGVSRRPLSAGGANQSIYCGCGARRPFRDREQIFPAAKGRTDSWPHYGASRVSSVSDSGKFLKPCGGAPPDRSSTTP